MLDYANNTKDWVTYKLSRLGVYDTKEIDKESYDNIGSSQNQNSIYKLNNSYYEFEKRELTKADEVYISLKILDELQSINTNSDTIKTDESYVGLKALEEIEDIKNGIKSIKNCVIFFVILTIITLTTSGIMGYMAIEAINDMISSLYY